MGLIQGAVNSALSGTAFLLNQSGITKEMRDKIEYKKREKELIDTIKEVNNQNKQVEIGSPYLTDDEEKDINNKARYKSVEGLRDELLDLRKNSPIHEDRLETSKKYGMQSFMELAKKDLEERVKEKKNAAAVKERRRSLLTNPNATNEQVMEAFKR